MSEMSAKLIIFCICVMHSIVINGKIYKRCELVVELKNRHQIPLEEIGDWICLMFWESGLDTKAHRIGNFDGSSNYGILQINDLLWCQSSGRKNNTNFCDASCDKFRDSNITDDMQCGKIIHKLQGFDAWGNYNTRCRSDTTSYVEGCNITPPSIETKHNSTEPETKVPKPAANSGKGSKKRTTMISQLVQAVQMAKTAVTIPETTILGLSKKKRSTRSGPPVRKQVTKRGLTRAKRGLLGQDSINPFEDARIFVFNPLCCFNWKAAEVEWSNAKNWYKLEISIEL